MAGKKQKQEGVGAWIAIVILFAVGLWPIALVMLLVKLFGNDGQKRRQAPPPAADGGAEPAAAASAGTAGRAKKAVRSAMKSPAVKKSNAKWLKIIGAVLAVCGLAACWSTIEMMIWLGGVEPWYIEELLWALAIAAAGGAMFCSGVSIGRSLSGTTSIWPWWELRGYGSGTAVPHPGLFQGPGGEGPAEDDR